MGTKIRTGLSAVKYDFLIYKSITKELKLIVAVSEAYAITLTTLQVDSAALN
jgi:hypothetical protein